MVSVKGVKAELEESFTNINVTGSAFIDWLSGLTTAIGTGEVGAGELGSGAVVAAALGSNAVTTPHIKDINVTAEKQYFVGAGSPPAGAQNVQTGANVLSSGSRWVSFGKKYETAPYVVANPLEEAVNADGVWVSATSVHAGSFLAAGSGTSTGSFTWLAIGSGSW